MHRPHNLLPMASDVLENLLSMSDIGAFNIMHQAAILEGTKYLMPYVAPHACDGL
jgi:hypothetical protein